MNKQFSIGFVIALVIGVAVGAAWDKYGIRMDDADRPGFGRGQGMRGASQTLATEVALQQSDCQGGGQCESSADAGTGRCNGNSAGCGQSGQACSGKQQSTVAFRAGGGCREQQAGHAASAAGCGCQTSSGQAETACAANRADGSKCTECESTAAADECNGASDDGRAVDAPTSTSPDQASRSRDQGPSFEHDRGQRLGPGLGLGLGLGPGRGRGWGRNFEQASARAPRDQAKTLDDN